MHVIEDMYSDLKKNIIPYNGREPIRKTGVISNYELGYWRFFLKNITNVSTNGHKPCVLTILPCQNKTGK